MAVDRKLQLNEAFMILIVNNKEEMIYMIVIMIGRDGVDLRQEDVEYVYVEFVDGTTESFVSEDTDAVILNHSEVKYISVDFSEEE